MSGVAWDWTGEPRNAVWLKQNCGVSCGRSDGCDIVAGEDEGLGGEGCEGAACCQKKCARSDDVLMMRDVGGGNGTIDSTWYLFVSIDTSSRIVVTWIKVRAGLASRDDTVNNWWRKQMVSSSLP